MLLHPGFNNQRERSCAVRQLLAPAEHVRQLPAILERVPPPREDNEWHWKLAIYHLQEPLRTRIPLLVRRRQPRTKSVLESRNA